jgi:hypothetical protein
VVGHVSPNIGVEVSLDWTQQLRYGERTARGIAEGVKSGWALTFWERRRATNGRRIVVSCDIMRDIAAALFRPSVTSRGMTSHSVEQEAVVGGL